jgi:hypothetical protein
MPDSMTVVALQQMKRDGRKIACIVAWDSPMAKIADRAGDAPLRPDKAIKAVGGEGVPDVIHASLMPWL